VIECCGLSGLGPSGFADPYAQVVILGPTGLMSEVRKGLIHRKDNDPQMNETFFFPLSETQLKDAIVRYRDKGNSQNDESTKYQPNVSFPLQGELVAPHVTLRGPLPGPGHVTPMLPVM
jgi:hypothetical protein